MVTNIISGIILLVLLWGRSIALKNRDLHIKVMFGVIITDILLVVYLVVAHRALGKVGADMHYMLFIHIPFALASVLLYLLMIPCGLKLKNGQEEYRPKMRLYDRILVFTRTATFITSVLLVLLK